MFKAFNPFIVLVSISAIHSQQALAASNTIDAPFIAGQWRLLTSPEPLASLELPPRNQEPLDPPEPNDHHIFQAADGSWHLWACVRGTDVGRLLAHWRTDDFFAGPWEFTGEVMRADRNAGESLVTWQGQEFIQSPFIVQHNRRFYMIYGGYATGYNSCGEPTLDYGSMQNQISLASSDDGLQWKRVLNANGFSRIFVGPGAARDPSLLKINNLWHCYYTGHRNENVDEEAILVRTSKTLLERSEWEVAHYVDPAYRSSRTCESPVVIARNGLYYLFRSGGYTGDGNGSVAVFVSADPKNFGRSGDGSAHYLCNIKAHAPEVITGPDNRLYITKIHSPETGYAIHIAPLQWKPLEAPSSVAHRAE